MTIIRDCRSGDLEAVQRMNESALPAVNSLTIDDLAWFLEKASYFRVADTGRELVAFLIGLNEGVDYASLNYRWFGERYDAFAYVDRIAVNPTARRQGLANRFYADFEDRCAQASGRVVCEVNLRPANDGSMRFHEHQGFVQVGSQETENGAKEVALMLKDLRSLGMRSL
ncbi:MAG: GNAT family N-acetyltransferase [Woeseiaceae bacterium]|nr:GNAT family N-acetyltransferase [Woeseiaceae bacterium]